MKNLILILMLVLWLAGCGGSDSGMKPTAANANAVKTGQAEAIVTKINTETGSIELDHKEIKGMMPAMQMEFNVSDKKMLDNLKIGDKVFFTLEDNAGREQITKISKIE
jgi:Cu/Ag efflux protein CusF